MSWLVKGGRDMDGSRNRSPGPLLQGIGLVSPGPRASLNCPAAAQAPQLLRVETSTTSCGPASFWPAGLTRANRAFLRRAASVRGAQVAHPALHAADEGRQDLVHRSR